MISWILLIRLIPNFIPRDVASNLCPDRFRIKVIQPCVWSRGIRVIHSLIHQERQILEALSVAAQRVSWIQAASVLLWQCRLSKVDVTSSLDLLPPDEEGPDSEAYYIHCGKNCDSLRHFGGSVVSRLFQRKVWRLCSLVLGPVFTFILFSNLMCSFSVYMYPYRSFTTSCDCVLWRDGARGGSWKYLQKGLMSTSSVYWVCPVPKCHYVTAHRGWVKVPLFSHFCVLF